MEKTCSEKSGTRHREREVEKKEKKKVSRGRVADSCMQLINGIWFLFCSLPSLFSARASPGVFFATASTLIVGL